MTKEEAQAKAAECGLQCAIYDDYDKMLAQDGIDIISIASPPDCHCRHAVGAAGAGKHMLLEKAMATTLHDARAIRDAVAKAGVKSVVGLVLRWNPLFDSLRPSSLMTR